MRLAVDDLPIATKLGDRQAALKRTTERTEPLFTPAVKPNRGFGKRMAGPALAGLEGLDARLAEGFDDVTNGWIEIHGPKGAASPVPDRLRPERANAAVSGPRLTSWRAIL